MAEWAHSRRCRVPCRRERASSCLLQRRVLTCSPLPACCYPLEVVKSLGAKPGHRLRAANAAVGSADKMNYVRTGCDCRLLSPPYLCGEVVKGGRKGEKSSESAAWSEGALCACSPRSSTQALKKLQLEGFQRICVSAGAQAKFLIRAESVRCAQLFLLLLWHG